MIPVLIIPVLNRYDLLDRSLESIDYDIHDILVINNGVEDWEPERDDLNIHILDMPSNQGVSGSWNLGIKSYPHAPWWLISSADTSFIPGSLKQFDEYSNSDRCIKSNAAYSCFSIGENIVADVGLFDEYIYPAYYEDNDYDDRMVLAGYLENILCPGIQVDDSGGSQTIKSDNKLMERNHDTFRKNRDYYHNKKNTGDYSVKGWDLTRRRDNEWLR
jgi:GT2 family glycosyltransferase